MQDMSLALRLCSVTDNTRAGSSGACLPRRRSARHRRVCRASSRAAQPLQGGKHLLGRRHRDCEWLGHVPLMCLAHRRLARMCFGMEPSPVNAATTPHAQTLSATPRHAGYRANLHANHPWRIAAPLASRASPSVFGAVLYRLGGVHQQFVGAVRRALEERPNSPVALIEGHYDPAHSVLAFVRIGNAVAGEGEGAGLALEAVSRARDGFIPRQP